MAKYYTKVTLKRMSELLDLKVDETEDFLSKMVSIFLFTFWIILHIYVSFSLQMVVQLPLVIVDLLPLVIVDLLIVDSLIIVDRLS